jgi:DNA-binding transcriptional ArsR family regulator/uncharacterized protein YndB with AHSA1/START domain
MKADPVWRAVADPTRRRLIELLRGGPRTTGDLCRAFTTTRFAVMKHLGVLERCGVVSVRRSGRERWNALNPEPLRALEGRWPAAEHSVAIRPAAEHGAQAKPAPAAITVSVFIDVPPWRVFDALTVNIAAWWGAPHLVAADASNLILEPQPGGRFYEEWGHRQGVLRGIVAAIRQDNRLELTGTLFGVTPSTLCFVLERREGGTMLTTSLSGAERGILDDLVSTRLKSFVEHGIRSGLAS